jgi:hypothetical protein
MGNSHLKYDFLQSLLNPPVQYGLATFGAKEEMAVNQIDLRPLMLVVHLVDIIALSTEDVG